MNRTSEQTFLLTTIKVRLEAQKSFALWQEKMNKIVADFPGFVSLEMRPEQKADYVEWTTVLRFRTRKDVDNWRYSRKRKELLREAKSLFIENNPIEEVDPESYKEKKSVTEVFVTRVTLENYERYRAWASKIQQIEAQFPGYEGIYIQAPEKEKGGNWITILRFDTPEHLDGWLSSPERQEVLKQSESIVEELQSHRVVSPFAGWFADISKSTGEVPAAWKQTMLVLLVLFPIVMLELKFLSPLTKSLNSSLATFIGNAISVTLVTWPMMPIVIHCLRWWLAPGSEHRIKKIIFGAVIVILLYVIEIISFWHLL